MRALVREERREPLGELPERPGEPGGTGKPLTLLTRELRPGGDMLLLGLVPLGLWLVSEPELRRIARSGSDAVERLEGGPSMALNRVWNVPLRIEMGWDEGSVRRAYMPTSRAGRSTHSRTKPTSPKRRGDGFHSGNPSPAAYKHVA